MQLGQWVYTSYKEWHPPFVFNIITLGYFRNLFQWLDPSIWEWIMFTRRKLTFHFNIHLKLRYHRPWNMMRLEDCYLPFAFPGGHVNHFFGERGVNRAIPVVSPIILEDDESVVASMSERTGTRSGTAPTPVSRQVRDESMSGGNHPQEIWWRVREPHPNRAFVSAKSKVIEKIEKIDAL